MTDVQFYCLVGFVALFSFGLGCAGATIVYLRLLDRAHEGWRQALLISKDAIDEYKRLRKAMGGDNARTD